MTRRTVEVLDHDPQWRVLFEQEQNLLTAALGDTAVAAHHIGSTSVPGLAAKPIIDILLEVTDLEALDRAAPALDALGYEAKGQNGIAGRRYFQKGGLARTHHLHAFRTGDRNLLRHLAFRDYLVAHPSVALAYADLKRRLASEHRYETVKYQDGKEEFILQHQAMALARASAGQG
jgi:GrpB-like predicted nucleotidyltransferase (UPF0157 family)